MKLKLRNIIAKKNLHLLWSVLGVIIFAVTLWVLFKMLGNLHWRDIRAQLGVLSQRQITLSLIFTVLGYLVLTGYDLLGVRYLGRVISAGKVIFASFLSYIFSINVGMSVIGASTVRLRLYTAWGLSALEIARLVIFAGLSNWLGLLALLGVSFLIHPLDLPPEIRLPDWLAIPASIVLLLLILVYFVICGVRKTPLRIFSWEIALPRLRYAIPQVVIGMLDWCLAAAVLYVLLPPGKISFLGMLPAFLLAMSLGLGSHVPGGLGVFELLLISMLQSEISKVELLGALIIFRAFYYLLPLMTGALLMGGYEVSQRHKVVLRVQETFLRWAGPMVPLFFALMAFVGGLVLLFSGALPIPPDRLAWIGERLPLAVIEMAHLAGCLIGVGLLFLAVGLRQRLCFAYWFTLVLLLAGIIVSLLQGGELWETIFLAITLLPLLGCRREFYRRASLWTEPLSGSWGAANVIVLLGAIWLGVFSYKHLHYHSGLWQEFSLSYDVPRFLRGMAGATGLMLLLGMARVIAICATQRKPRVIDPAAVARLSTASERASARLALSGDKQFLLNREQTAFIMYGSGRRSRVALGDPIGEPQGFPSLAWEFRELCDRSRLFCVFWGVDAEALPLYIDLGLALQKMGTEGHIKLGDFDLRESKFEPLRREHESAREQGYRFEMVAPEGVPALLPQLREVSSAGLSRRSGPEPGFVCGTFNDEYLRRFPVGIVRQADRLVAFANLLPGANRTELAPDLLRYRPDQPLALTTYLLTESILWARQQGFAWFNLGLAPLEGAEARPLAPLWNRLSPLLAPRLTAEPSPTALRSFQEKFHPEWRPKYIASPGGFAFPLVLADIVSLITRTK